MSLKTRERRCSTRGRLRLRRRLRAVHASSGSTLVTALESAYEMVRSEFPELPRVVMITGSGRSAFGLKWGHFGYDAWKLALDQGRRPELFIGGERLGTGAELTMQTLLHECAHALAMVRGVQDTSRQHRYHNRRFVALAEELGLAYVQPEPHPSIGFSAVEITPAGRERWREAIQTLAKAIMLSMDAPSLSGGLTGLPGGDGGKVTGGPSAPKTGGRSLMRFSCSCIPERVMRMAPSVWEVADVTCGACGERFE